MKQLLETAKILFGPERLPGSPGAGCGITARSPMIGPAWRGMQYARIQSAALRLMSFCCFSVWPEREEKEISRTGATDYNFNDHHLAFFVQGKNYSVKRTQPCESSMPWWKGTWGQ